MKGCSMAILRNYLDSIESHLKTRCCSIHLRTFGEHILCKGNHEKIKFLEIINREQVVISRQFLFRPKPIIYPDRFVFVFQEVNLDYGHDNYYGNKSKRDDEYDCSNKKHSICDRIQNR